MNIKALAFGVALGLALPVVPAFAAGQPKVHVSPGKARPGDVVNVKVAKKAHFETVASEAFTGSVPLKGRKGTATIDPSVKPGTYSVLAVDADSTRTAAGQITVARPGGHRPVDNARRKADRGRHHAKGHHQSMQSRLKRHQHKAKAKTKGNHYEQDIPTHEGPNSLFG